MSIVGDNPIRRQENDALGRFNIARSFAQQVLRLDVTCGVVVGILGPWGSGKTSFVNLARNEFTRADVPILDFNPWMFSGAEQLVESFFVEIAAQLKVLPGLAEVGNGLEGSGEAFSGMGWLPLVGVVSPNPRNLQSAKITSAKIASKSIGFRLSRNA